MSFRLLLGLLLAAMLLVPQSAFACKMRPPEMGHYIEDSAVIAVGSFVAADPEMATFEVEYYLKGDAAVHQLTVVNKSINLEANCQATLSAGSRFASGMRAVVFLVPNTTTNQADWQPYGLMFDGVWPIDDQAVTVNGIDMNSSQPLELSSVQASLVAATGVQPFAPQGATLPAKSNISPLLIALVLIAVALAAFAFLRRQSEQRQI